MDKREKPKRKRIGYSNEQLMYLEESFAAVPYLTRVRRIELARILGLTERNVKIWYQNKRMRLKNSKRKSGRVEPTGGGRMSSMGDRAADDGRLSQVPARSNSSPLPPFGAGQLLHRQFNEHLLSYAPLYTMPCTYYVLDTVFAVVAAMSSYAARPPARLSTEAGPSRATSPLVLDLSQSGPNRM